MPDGNVFFSCVSSVFFLTQNCFLECTPWQSCRTNSLELHTRTPSDITGRRGAAGGRQPAAATPPLYIVYINKVPIRDVG